MLTVAVTRSERTDALLDGTVQVPGLDVQWVALPPGEIFGRMLRSLEFEASEMSFSYALMASDRGTPSLLPLPIFLVRAFRHGLVYVSTDGPIARAADLPGCTFALPDFFNADAFWFRQMLAECYAVDPGSVRWLQFGAGYGISLPEPRGYHVVQEPGAKPEDLLKSGRADVVYWPGLLRAAEEREGWLRPLFRDAIGEMRTYFLETGILPIMHGLVMRRDACERHPGVAGLLYEAFVEARDQWYRRLETGATALTGLPWTRLEEVRSHMGRDFWPYGVEANRRALTVAGLRLHEDGLTSKAGDPAEWFVEELRWT